MMRRALQVSILIPVYDDWESLAHLLRDIHAQLGGASFTYDVTVIDDASPTHMPQLSNENRPANCVAIQLLRLRKNVGHQRAIAVGLVEMHSRADADFVIVMDGDGEDAPQHIPLLLEASLENDGSAIVFARRSKRLEGTGFRIGYELYCGLHRVLVGEVPRVGNFSVIPARFIPALVVDANLWNHYAATVLASRLPQKRVRIPRSKRYAGKSKLNFNALVVHGISALACYSERIGVRALAASSVLLALIFLAVLVVSGIRLFTPLAIPGWASTVTGFLLTFSLQVLTLALAFCLLILARRQDVGFVPLRDAAFYVEERRVL